MICTCTVPDDQSMVFKNVDLNKKDIWSGYNAKYELSISINSIFFLHKTLEHSASGNPF